MGLSPANPLSKGVDTVSSKSTRKRRRRKSALNIDRPPKPSPDFPLCPAHNGYWQKKISDKLLYFARWGKAARLAATARRRPTRRRPTLVSRGVLRRRSIAMRQAARAAQA
jgi:hypothetical protein